jgi:HSP20 family molecular chaperone IbpA
MQMETEVVKIVSIDYDEGSDSLQVEVPLPQAEKNSIDLQVYRDWFALRALKVGEQEADYMGEFNLCCPVDQDSVTASYEDGLLRIRFPLNEEAARPKRVAIN